MQLTGQNNGGVASSAFLLARNCNRLARTCIMNMRNATCVRTQTSKVPTRVTLLFIPYTVTVVCVPAHFALRMLLAFSQPVNCVFWPIKTLNWLVAASKLHKHWGTCYTAEWPYCPFAILWLNIKTMKTRVGRTTETK